MQEYLDRRKQARKAETPNRVCTVCGKPVPIGRGTFKYCSEACKRQAARERKKTRPKNQGPLRKVCPVCGKEFETRVSFQIYCSQACQYIHTNKRQCEERRKENQKVDRGMFLITGPIPEVVDEMQPEIGKVYPGKICRGIGAKEIIILEGIGKYGLIVYPEDVRAVALEG